MPNGYMGKILRVDLTTGEHTESAISEKDMKLFLGGKTLAAKILYDELAPDTEPLSPQNMLVVTTGPLTGTGAPSSSRFNISTLSPQTGLPASSNCGGSFGYQLKKAGYDGLVLLGRAERPVWLEIKEGKAELHDASELWGMKTAAVQEALGGRSGKIVIGPAGENLVCFASIVSQERVAGRCGVGAVMGSKNLKAVTAEGSCKVEVHDREKLKAINKKWTERLRTHPLTGSQLPRLGTAGLVSPMQARGLLATRNYKYGKYEKFESVNGEALAEEYLVKNKGCLTCPIQCARIVRVGDKEVKGPELETLGLFGANIENDNLEAILRWNYELDELGMDTISVANTLAWAMEAGEHGRFETSLRFGSIDNISQIIEDIAYRRGEGELLCLGSKELSRRFGGADYAMHAKGLELAAYEPRAAVGQGLGYAVSNRGGCHLNGGYLVILEGLGLNVDSYTPKAKADVTMAFQDVMECISASGNCLFTSYAMFPMPLITKPEGVLARIVNKVIPHVGGVVRLANKFPEKVMPIHVPTLINSRAIAAATGMKMSFGRMMRIGERGYNLERLLGARFGVSAKDDTLPGRLTKEEQIPGRPETKVPLKAMKVKYYAARGWDENGLPTAKTVKRLKLDGLKQW